MTVDDIERRMADMLPQLGKLDATVKFILDDETLYLDATENPPSLSRDDDVADCTIKISPANMAKLMDGKLDPMLAYTMGKLKISGKMGVAMKLTSVFD